MHSTSSTSNLTTTITIHHTISHDDPSCPSSFLHTPGMKLLASIRGKQPQQEVAATAEVASIAAQPVAVDEDELLVRVMRVRGLRTAHEIHRIHASSALF